MRCVDCHPHPQSNKTRKTQKVRTKKIIKSKKTNRLHWILPQKMTIKTNNHNQKAKKGSRKI